MSRGFALRVSAVFALVVVLVIAPVVAEAAQTAGELTGSPALAEATCAIVTNSTGDVLWSKNDDVRMAPASITKIMTAMCALDAGVPLTDKVAIQGHEFEEGAQLAGYKAGDTATFAELMKVMLVYSANDAAYEIAVRVDGSVEKFAERMNAKAAELGMENTHFKNPHGLEEDNHYSSAADLAVMGRHAMTNYPYIATMVHTRSVTVPVGGVQQSFASTDDLMDYYDGLIGIKTGAVASGTTFLGAAERHGVRLYSCVLGCETKQGRFDDTAALFDWVYDQVIQKDVVNADLTVGYVQDMFHFGWYYPVKASSDVTIYITPYEARATFQRTMRSSRILSKRGEVRGVQAWMQSTRMLAACTYRASVRPVRHVWCGTFNSALFGDGKPLGVKR